MDATSYAKAEDLESISEQRLVVRLGTVRADVQFELSRVLRFLLDL